MKQSPETPPLHLTGLSLAGYRSIREIRDLQFGPINVLIGANGAGKSNLLSFFRLLNAMMSRALQEFIGRQGGAQAILHYGPRTTPQLAAELIVGTRQDGYRYTFRLAHAPGDTLVFAEEAVGRQRKGRQEEQLVLGAGHREALLGERASQDPLARSLSAALSRLRHYQFHDTSAESRLRASCESDDHRYLYGDGANLAAVLRRLHAEQPKRYDRLLHAIRIVAPFLADFVLEPIGNGHPRLALRWRGKGAEYEFGPHHLSDGTLRFVALATLLALPRDWRPTVVVIDEPELGLHPRALAALAGLIREAAADTQILVATQSATFVDFFEPSEVIVTDRADGASQFHRLDADALRDWLAEFTLGELWRRNVIAGGPGHE